MRRTLATTCQSGGIASVNVCQTWRSDSVVNVGVVIVTSGVVGGRRPARRVLTTSLTDALTRWAEFTLNRPMGWLTPKGQVVHEISRTT